MISFVDKYISASLRRPKQKSTENVIRKKISNRKRRTVKSTSDLSRRENQDSFWSKRSSRLNALIHFMENKEHFGSSNEDLLEESFIDTKLKESDGK